MSSALFILNEAPYGSERSYNALRLAGALCALGAEGAGGLLQDGVDAGQGPAQLADWTVAAEKVLVF
jgi:uncharacterized protein involved in oxidation of intracellular sulfur